MGRDELINIWKTGNDRMFHEQKFDKAMIEKLLRKKTGQNTRPVYFNIVFHFFLQLINIVMASVNLGGYKNNLVVCWTLIALLVVSVGFLLFGTYLFIKYREINKFSEPLMNLINKQLHYLKTSYESWLFVIAFSTLILIFNIGLMVDYNNGSYHIYHKDVFIIVNIAVFLFIYATQKIASLFFTKSIKANLVDLRNGILDETMRLEKNRKKYKWVWFVLVILLTIIFILGIFKL